MHTERDLPFPDHKWRHKHDRSRVLIECSDPAIAWAAERILAEAGYETATCWGPGCANGDCPLLKDGRCDLVTQADVVLQSFSLEEHRRFPVLHAIRSSAPSVAVCVEVPEPSRHKLGDDLDGCYVIDRPLTSERLVQAVGSVTPLPRGSRRRGRSA